jgi:beta-lactamase class D
MSGRKIINLFFLLLLVGCTGAGGNTNAVAGANPNGVAGGHAPVALESPDLSLFFKDTVGCFVLYDLKENRFTRYNEARARERFSPKSTFKIANSLVGLETGVIRDADFVIPWDRQKYPPGDWNAEPFIHWKQDHNLRTAFQHSVLWYYREFATRVGAERMRKSVEALGYGNKKTSGAVNQFWLNDTLKISADEQIDFLRRLYTYQLPVSRRSADIVKEIMVRERTPAYTLSGKTGGGSIAEGRAIGWYVGHVETSGRVYLFALNIEGPTYLSIRDKRLELTNQILTRLGVLPNQ